MLSIHLLNSGGMPILLPLQVVGLVSIILYVVILLMIVLTFLNILHYEEYEANSQTFRKYRN
jgi:predicted acyltransferase